MKSTTTRTNTSPITIVTLIVNSAILAAMVIAMCAGCSNQEVYSANYICPECEMPCEIVERAYVTTLHPEGQDYVDTTYYCQQCDEEYHFSNAS